MEPRLTTTERTARELEGAQRRSGTSWGGNRPGQWAVLGLACLSVLALAALLVWVA